MMDGANSAESVEIQWVKAYRIDNGAKTIEEVSHEGELREYVLFYVHTLLDVRKTAPYKPRSQESEVISLVRRLAEMTDDEAPVEAESGRHAINERFLQKEMAAQQKIARLDTNIKNGCLIHALVLRASRQYYLIAKLQWDDFLEINSMKRTSGIAFSEKILGRSCLMRLAAKGGNCKVVEHVDISMSTANTKYFVSEFLEVDPCFDDEKSTELMSTHVVNLIDRTFKRSDPRTRILLKNAFLCALRSSDWIDYSRIEEEVFAKYFKAPGCPVKSEVAERFMDKLNDLPEKVGFSPQCELVASAIKPRILSTRYALREDVTLIIENSTGLSINNSIVSGSESNGRSFVKVYTHNEEALYAFNNN